MKQHNTRTWLKQLETSHSLADLAKNEDLSREGIRKILLRHHPEEYARARNRRREHRHNAWRVKTEARAAHADTLRNQGIPAERADRMAGLTPYERRRLKETSPGYTPRPRAKKRTVAERLQKVKAAHRIRQNGGTWRQAAAHCGETSRALQALTRRMADQYPHLVPGYTRPERMARHQARMQLHRTRDPAQWLKRLQDGASLPMVAREAGVSHAWVGRAVQKHFPEEYEILMAPRRKRKDNAPCPASTPSEPPSPCFAPSTAHSPPCWP